MPTTEVVRAWIDRDYRAGLSADELAALPEHPAGSVDDELDQLLGAFNPADRSDCPITSFSRNPCCF